MKKKKLEIKRKNSVFVGHNDCIYTEWIIYTDLSVKIKKKYSNETKEKNVLLDEKKYNTIIDNIELVKTINKKVFALDGEFWEFKEYSNGSLVWKRDLDYIYEIEPLEKIVDILIKL